MQLFEWRRLFRDLFRFCLRRLRRLANRAHLLWLWLLLHRWLLALARRLADSVYVRYLYLRFYRRAVRRLLQLARCVARLPDASFRRRLRLRVFAMALVVLFADAH